MKSLSCYRKMSLSVRPQSEIPDKLQEVDQWLCWQKREAEKVPIDPESYYKIDAFDETNQLDYDTAVEYASKNGKISGVGFALSFEDGFILVDLDRCLNDNLEFTDSDCDRVYDNLESYSEISTGGYGIHIILEGLLPDYGHSHKAPIEMYNARKFFTVTGRQISEKPSSIKNQDQSVREMYNEYKPFEKWRSTE